MNRIELKKYFKATGPAILPVIHVVDNEQTEKNVRIALHEGAQGVFLINHDFDVEQFIPIIRHIRKNFPALWLGVNFIAVTGKHAFPRLAQLEREGVVIDAYWGDDARIDEKAEPDRQPEAKEISDAKIQSGWSGLYFGGTAFKKQRPVAEDDYAIAADIAGSYMDVVTTSGSATGQRAQQTKISEFRGALRDKPLALASGVTPENITGYANDVDAVLVATGINYPGDFYNIDPASLRRLIRVVSYVGTDQAGKVRDRLTEDRDNRWYLSLMAPRSRGDKYAWLDPSSAYINARSFNTILDDLLETFATGEIDVVAGFDAAGFVLGAAMAARLGKGFLTIRKGGKIPVDFDSVPMNNYSGQTESMEMRKPAFGPGTRVLLVDQWIETGGTMSAGVELVERQDGIVAGIAAVCIEENGTTNSMRQKYKTVSCVSPGSAIQQQCNAQTLKSFKSFKPEITFPVVGKNN